MNYFERIWESICYYADRHGHKPDTIFVSNQLFCKLAQNMCIQCCECEPFHRYCGIPVRTYVSQNEEYYLAEGAYWFE